MIIINLNKTIFYKKIKKIIVIINKVRINNNRIIISHKRYQIIKFQNKNQQFNKILIYPQIFFQSMKNYRRRRGEGETVQLRVDHQLQRCDGCRGVAADIR